MPVPSANAFFASLSIRGTLKTMSSSRLTPPRSPGTRVAQTRQRARSSTGTTRHLRLWEAIRRTRQELSDWLILSDQIDAQFRLHIVPREQSLTHQYCTMTQALIEHFADTSLSTADQSLLGLWIVENLESLNDHPFVSQENRSNLVSRWTAIVNRGGVVEQQLARLSRQQSTTTFSNNSSYAEELADTEEDDDIVFDFGWHKKSDPPTDKAQSQSAGTKQQKTHRSEKKKSASEPNAADINKTVGVLEQRLSVDRLFRQLARVLHPDREQDEQLKAEKHSLMSQCLKARQDKDINTLLTLYCEHVGELPEDLTDDNHEDLIRALQLQLKQLQRELREKRVCDPLQTLIIERYSGPGQDGYEQRIDQHAQSLDVEILHLKALSNSLETEAGLIDALSERRALENDRLIIDEMTGLS